MNRSCRSLICASAILVGLLGCATPPQDPEDRAQWEEENDPLEPLNREIFAVNRVIDGLLIKPAAMIYRGVIPDEGRDAIRNVLGNLKEPVYAANHLLQGDVGGAGDAVARFAVNTTVGVAGIMQPSADMGLPRRPNDFGKTLHIWGTGSGPYLVLPLGGSSALRDLAGSYVDGFFSPLRYVGRYEGRAYVGLFRNVLGTVDSRSRNLDAYREIERNSVDYYATMRARYLQRRAQLIEQKAVMTAELPDF